MESIRKNSQYISIGLTILTFFFVLGIYANSVEKNTDEVESLKEDLKKCEMKMENGVQIAITAKQKANSSIDYNKKLEVLTLDVKSRLSAIETDIKWIKQSLSREEK